MAAQASALHLDVESNQAAPSQGARERRHIWFLQGAGLAGLMLLGVFSVGGLSHHGGQHDEKDAQSISAKPLGYDAGLGFNSAMPAFRGTSGSFLPAPGSHLRAPGRLRAPGLAMSMSGGDFKTILNNLAPAEELSSLRKEVEGLEQDRQLAIELDDFSMAEDCVDDIRELRARDPAALGNDVRELMLAAGTSIEEAANARNNLYALTAYLTEDELAVLKW
jgi:hypothetical protein